MGLAVRTPSTPYGFKGQEGKEKEGAEEEKENAGRFSLLGFGRYFSSGAR